VTEQVSFPNIDTSNLNQLIIFHKLGFSARRFCLPLGSFRSGLFLMAKRNLITINLQFFQTLSIWDCQRLQPPLF